MDNINNTVVQNNIDNSIVNPIKDKNNNNIVKRKQKKITITRKEVLFCYYYMHDKECFLNATKSYCKAYRRDINDKKQYNIASVNACNILKKSSILTTLEEILVNEGFNNPATDRELLSLVKQNEDKQAKLNAIKEYNKLKSRITEHVDIKQTTRNFDIVIDVKGKVDNNKIIVDNSNDEDLPL